MAREYGQFIVALVVLFDVPQKASFFWRRGLILRCGEGVSRLLTKFSEDRLKTALSLAKVTDKNIGAHQSFHRSDAICRSFREEYTRLLEFRHRRLSEGRARATCHDGSKNDLRLPD